MRFICTFCLFFSFLLAGCKNSSEVIEEKQDTLFVQGQQLLSENRPDEAFKIFQRLLTKRSGFCPATHFELGQLYLSNQHDPIFAIYHFRQHILQEPDSKIAHMVIQMIETAKKEFVRSLPLNDHYSESPEYLNLMEVLKQVRAENSQLKTKLAQLTSKPDFTIESKNNYKQSAHIESNKERTYTVQDDDSLSKISLKMYGSAVKWKIIFDANKSVLSSPNSLKIGMKLIIPPLK